MAATASAHSDSPASSPGTARSLPLERKLPMWILGLLAGVFAVWLAVAYYETRRTAELAAEDRVATLARTVSTSFEGTFAMRLAMLRRVAHDSAVIATLRNPTSEASSTTEAALASLSFRGDTTNPGQLWTRDGRTVAQIGLSQPSELPRGRNDFARAAAASDSGLVGPLFATSRRVAYWVIVPVRIDNELLGFVAQQRRVTINPNFARTLREVLGQDISVYLHNADNSVWTDFGGAELPPPRTAATLDGLLVQERRDSGRWLAASHTLQGTPMVMSVEMPYAQILARPQRLIRILVLLAFALVGGAALAAWLLGHRLVRPLVEITSAAESIAQGDYDRRVHDAGRDEMGRLAAAFNQMASRVQASHDASRRALRTEEFLGAASRLLAGSFSDETLISDLARCCVPRLADFCTIHMVDDDGSIRRVVTAHCDAAMEPTVRALASHYPSRIDGSGDVSVVIRTQTPVIKPQLDLAALKSAASSPEVAALLDVVRPTSFMCVPLVARGRAFGAMSFTMTTATRQFDDEDIAVASELAQRTAVAIDNAMIYRRSLTLRLEAEAASQAKSDFMAKMSHEIRTPINAMVGYAELIEMGLSGPINDAQRSQLARIRSSGEHLTALVSEILDLAKIEAGGILFNPATGSVGEAADAALALIRPQAASKGVLLASKADGDAKAQYLGDPRRVQQILTNLLANAIKFTEQGGSVTLRCGNGSRRGDAEGSWAWLCVEDTGIGIAPEDHERIFHPFVQVDGGYTRAQGGTGLGLTISRNLAQMMGGDLAVESSSGHGSRFTLWLPSPGSCKSGAEQRSPGART